MDMNEENRQKLTSAIKNYRDNRERLIKIQMSTKEAFNQITSILETSTGDLLNCVNINHVANISEDLGATIQDHDSDAKLRQKCESLTISIIAGNPLSNNAGEVSATNIENPAIAIVGQVKAGKSTFINVLLRKNVVAQAFERCTARLTRLHFSNKNYIHILDRDGKVVLKKKLNNTTIPKKYQQLSEEDRNKEDEINMQIVAGINSKFLQCGIDIIDSPGLSENETLDKMSKNVVKNMLPVVIYVIDGRTSVKQTDITYLTELKNSRRSLQIIFFITKLDTDDLNETTIKDPIELAKYKMEVAFKKLQYANLIPSSIKHWSDCPYFHGASLYQYMDYFKDKVNEETKYHFEQFGRFEKSLHDYLLERFEFKINETSETLINFHMDVLTKIIRRAQMLADFTKENLNQIVTMRRIEEELFVKIRSVISDSKEQLKDQLVQRLQRETDSLLNPIGDIEYPDSLGLPIDGYTTDQKLVMACTNCIMLVLCQGLENCIKDFVETELFQKYREAIEVQVTKRMQNEMDEHNERVLGKSPYRLTLERLLATKYKFNAISGITDVEGRSTIAQFMESILNSIKYFLKRLFSAHHTSSQVAIDVKSPAWKVEQARECLSHMDHVSLAEEVCKNLTEDFEEKHHTFLSALEYEHDFVQKDIRVNEETRKRVADLAPDFEGLLMLALDVKGRYQLQNVQEIEKIGQGAQGEVFKCVCGGRELAKKTTTLPVDQLNGIAEEVYYSYLFNHPHMLPLEAVAIHDTNEPDTKRIDVYSPLMKTDVSKFLKQRTKTTFAQRMNIGFQVAEALLYLHHQRIMHRDLKLANILLDDNDKVYLADYGFCKSMALTDHSFVGTPVHIAPEIVRKEIYDHKVDIFSFGILLWYLAEGSGRHPRFARVQSNIAQVLWAATEHNMRPEKLDYIPTDLWNLMERCWDNDTSVRPEIDVVIAEMRLFLANHEEL